jgi:beta-aspartyl-peptidase (threonine type)
MPDTLTNITLLIHGGSGRIHQEPLTISKENEYRQALAEAVQKGFELLQHGETSVSAIETAIKILEDSPLFNAGRGAVFSNDEVIELDASIMDGAAFKAGAVAGVQTVKHPISAARMVMENSEHVMMTGRGAEKFAMIKGLVIVDPTYFKTEERWQQIIQIKKTEAPLLRIENSLSKFGTVGAVALDKLGRLAAGTSTGGMLNKKYGRVGDSPIIGAGTYANHICAVSGTGHGEYFIRHTVARDIAALMEYKNLSVAEAAKAVLDKVAQAGGVGGVIALDASGNIAMPHSTEGMFWAYIKADGKKEINICNMIIE